MFNFSGYVVGHAWMTFHDMGDMAMAAAALVKVEALTIATGEIVGTSTPIEIANLMNCSKSFSTDERRILMLRRIAGKLRLPLIYLHTCSLNFQTCIFVQT
jgi:hypothetical protein